MDWHSSPFEPNLKFASELKGDLKTKYFEQHEKAKQTLEEFSCSLQNIFLKQQKLLNENIELSITNDKLRKIIDSQESNQQIAAIIQPPSSEILGASPNCKVRISSKILLATKNNNLEDKSSTIIQKENDFPPIYSEDFNSDLDDGSFIRCRTPPASVANSPVKIQSSPILSKRKKSSSKRSNSSVNTSTQSLDSNNDSKVNSGNASSLEKNIEIDADLSKEFEKEYIPEPLKPIENLQFPSQNNQDKNAAYKILNVSKTNYAKTEFVDKGKKSRQTTLCFKKVAPVVDISKVDLDDSLGNKSMSIMKRGNSWDDTYYQNSMTNQQLDSILTNMKILDSQKCVPKGSTRTPKNQNVFTKDNDYIEISPVQNGRSAKLRNKLIKKSDISKVKEKSKLSDEKFSFFTSNNNILQHKRNFENGKPEIKYEKLSLESNEPQRCMSDETYFSQAEMANHKNDMTNFEVDLTEYEDDDMQCDTPPLKKILLDSFDMIPGREEKVPDYVYKEGPVRKKCEKEQLPGWDCKDCNEYYGMLPEEERKQRQNKCSKHRGHNKPEQPETPASFWNPLINGTQDESSIFDY